MKNKTILRDPQRPAGVRKDPQGPAGVRKRSGEAKFTTQGHIPVSRLVVGWWVGTNYENFVFLRTFLF